MEMGPWGLVTLAWGPPTLGRALSAGCCMAAPASSGTSPIKAAVSQRERSIDHSACSKALRRIRLRVDTDRLHNQDPLNVPHTAGAGDFPIHGQMRRVNTFKAGQHSLRQQDVRSQLQAV